MSLYNTVLDVLSFNVTNIIVYVFVIWHHLFNTLTTSYTICKNIVHGSFIKLHAIWKNILCLFSKHFIQNIPILIGENIMNKMKTGIRAYWLWHEGLYPSQHQSPSWFFGTCDISILSLIFWNTTIIFVCVIFPF